MINETDIEAMRPRGRLIGLTGAAGAGKSTAARALVEIGWQNVKFASPLKDMAAALFSHCGVDRHRAIDGDLKDTPLPELGGKSPRYVMQTIGTQWGRDLIAPDFWVDIARRKIAMLLESGCDVAVDDVRFENEAAAIRALGGRVVAVVGRGGIGGGHVSESGVAADFTLQNTRGMAAFLNDVVYILHRTDCP